MSGLFKLLRAGLFALDAEDAHGLTIRALKNGLGGMFAAPPPDARLAQTVCGLSIPSPVGLAAGFDKNAEVPDAMLALGFGFAEVGTITPRPQEGNPRPRVFRLKSDRGVINRLGFNNAGLEAAKTHLAARRAAGRAGIVGANLGANKDSANRAADYAAGLEALYPYAEYFTVNVSSPNTPGLRDLQGKAALTDLLSSLIALRARLSSEHGEKPILLKIAPDLSDADKSDIAAAALATKIDGMIVSNTTVSRPHFVRDPRKVEAGGLSGAPLLDLSTSLLREMYAAVGKQMPLVGVGGVFTAHDVIRKLRAGASLVQLYSAMVYEGPGLPARLNRDLAAWMEAEGVDSLSQIIGWG